MLHNFFEPENVVRQQWLNELDQSSRIYFDTDLFTIVMKSIQGSKLSTNMLHPQDINQWSKEDTVR
jgi:hypothetical protein